MTEPIPSSENRLDRIEAILAGLAEAHTQMQVDLRETRQIVDSNARAIEANSVANADLRESQVQAHAELRESQERANAELRELLRLSHEQSRQRLEETTADLVVMLGSMAEQQAETSSQIEALLSGQHENRREHREFRTAIREMLQEIRRIWQRLAG